MGELGPCSDSAELRLEVGWLLKGLGRESNWRLKIEPWWEDLLESEILRLSLFRYEWDPVIWWLYDSPKGRLDRGWCSLRMEPCLECAPLLLEPLPPMREALASWL